MTCYSVQPRDWILVKGYEFLSFPKNIITNIGKNMSKDLSRKYSHKIFDDLKMPQKERFTKQKRKLVI